MTDTIQFSAEEMKQLQELQQSYQNKTIEFGQLKVQKILLEQQLKTLDDRQTQMEVDYVNIQVGEKELVDQLNKKYGPGSLDPTTGKFTPVEQEQEKPTESIQ